MTRSNIPAFKVALVQPLAWFKRSFIRNSIITAVLCAVLLLAGCAGAPLTTREKGTLAGGAIGAGTGALVGSAAGAPGAGAAIGGVLGAGGGYVVGNHLQNEQYQRHYYYGE